VKASAVVRLVAGLYGQVSGTSAGRIFPICHSDFSSPRYSQAFAAQRIAPGFLKKPAFQQKIIKKIILLLNNLCVM
jgi:hypothetical protein